jgi:microcystin degradation protein MlrC
MGRAVVLAAGQLRIVVSSRGTLGADPAFFECLGLAPEAALGVQVKSLMGWRAGYDAAPERGLVFDGPGATSLNFSRLPFTGARRELFPLTQSPLVPVSLWQSS